MTIPPTPLYQLSQRGNLACVRVYPDRQDRSQWDYVVVKRVAGTPLKQVILDEYYKLHRNKCYVLASGAYSILRTSTVLA